MVLGEDWREAFIDFIRDHRLPARIDAKSVEAARIL
jgi:nitrogen fixation protein